MKYSIASIEYFSFQCLKRKEYITLMHSFMLLDRSEEECGMIMKKYRHYRMPGKLIMNAEDEIITELMED